MLSVAEVQLAEEFVTESLCQVMVKSLTSYVEGSGTGLLDTHAPSTGVGGNIEEETLDGKGEELRLQFIKQRLVTTTLIDIISSTGLFGFYLFHHYKSTSLFTSLLQHSHLSCNIYISPATFTFLQQHLHLSCNIYISPATFTSLLQHLHFSSNIYISPATFTFLQQHLHLSCNIYITNITVKSLPLWFHHCHYRYKFCFNF